METPQPHKINREQDIRQSDEWGKYLESIGWKIRKTSSGIMIDIRPTFLGNFVKIQRPRKVTKKDLEEIEKICREEKCAYIKIEPDYDQDLSIFEKAGYRESRSPNVVPSTIFIDLTKSEEELWNDLSHSAKYSVNRAIREGYKAEFVKNPDPGVLREIYDVFVDTAKYKHFYLPPISQYSKRAELFGDRSYVCVVRNSEGKTQSGKFCLGHKNMVLFVTGGATAESRKNKSGYLLMWEAIKFFKNEDYEYFDLEGKKDERFGSFTSNWEGFTEFKKKFGGVELEFPLPRIKYLKKIYSLFAEITRTNF